MGQQTPIQWCDSSCNLEMGCNGCELWDPARGIRHCYAGNEHALHAGRPGWPKAFDQVTVFPHRLDEALRWKDLRGRSRTDKPWLDGMPRLVFLNNEGDTFTEDLPIDWLTPHLPRMAASSHVWIILTKRPARMLEWVRQCGTIPANMWLCVSITSTGTLGRLRPLYDLRELLPGHILGISAEPALDDLAPAIRLHHPDLAQMVSWVKSGGESGQRGAPARPCALEWLRGLRDFCKGKSAVFIKQLGGDPVENGETLRLRDRKHGGDWSEWPADLRVREMPLPCIIDGDGMARCAELTRDAS
jgi:protein gp37